MVDLSVFTWAHLHHTFTWFPITRCVRSHIGSWYLPHPQSRFCSRCSSSTFEESSHQTLSIFVWNSQERIFTVHLFFYLVDWDVSFRGWRVKMMLQVCIIEWYVVVVVCLCVCVCVYFEMMRSFSLFSFSHIQTLTYTTIHAYIGTRPTATSNTTSSRDAKKVTL